MKKIFTLLALTAAMFVGGAQQAQAKYVYFQPNDWANDGALLWVYAFEEGKKQTVSMTAVTESDIENYSNLDASCYKAEIDDDLRNIIFVRTSPSATEETIWNDGIKWNQSGNITYNDNTKWSYPGGWDNWIGTTSSVLPLTSYTFTFNNDVNWTTVKVFPYTEGADIYGPSWPGADMTETPEGSGVFTCTYKLTAKPENVIFTDGSAQTKDYTFVENTEYNFGLTDYYIISGSTPELMTAEAGVYSANVSGAGKWFAIAPSGALKEDLSGVHDHGWNYAVRPVTKGADWDINFQDYNGETTVGDGYSWSINANNDADVTITWNKSAGTFTITNAQTATVTESWGTYSNYYSYKADKKAYIVSEVKDNSAVLQEIAAETALPAGEGILLKETATITPASDAAGVTNLLKGSGNSKKAVTRSDYVLGKVNGVVGFYKVAEDADLAAHKAYLPSSAAPAAGFLGFTFADESTGISAVKGESEGMEIYNLAGQRQQSLKKGLNIVNGKKVLVK